MSKKALKLNLNKNIKNTYHDSPKFFVLHNSISKTPSICLDKTSWFGSEWSKKIPPE